MLRFLLYQLLGKFGTSVARNPYARKAVGQGCLALLLLGIVITLMATTSDSAVILTFIVLAVLVGAIILAFVARPTWREWLLRSVHTLKTLLVRTVTFTIMAVIVGTLFAFLEGGSMLLCVQTIPGETPVSPDAFRPLYDIAHSHLVLCVSKKGLTSLLVILLGSFVPLAWIGAVGSAIVYVPRFAVLGAGMGLTADLLTFILGGNRGIGDSEDDVLDQIVIYEEK